jgi:deazaflavin-dependent oxidoreductase (nitroreductase family)
VDETTSATLDYCYVTTTGRRTGHAHTIEIWFALADDTVYLLAGGGESSDWVRNIRADPTVGLRLGDREFIARARVVDDPEEDRRARELVYGKYAGSEPDLEAWRDAALPIAIDLPRADRSGENPGPA